MRYTLALLAAAVAVQASPVALPQGVSAKITPTGAAPPGCKPSFAGTFGIAVMNISTAAKGKRQVSTIADGQPQASTGAVPVSTISDHQPQASSKQVSAVSTISDHQPQAPTATAVSTISDHQPQAPTATAVSTISDHQPQAPTATAVSTISDHQPQAPTPSMHTMGHISQITDGQIQGGMHTVTMMPVSQISDGQIQATVTYMAVTTIKDGQPQAPTLPAVSTISDHQPQAPTGTAVSTISDHQPQAPTATATAVSSISDHQPQAPTGTAVSTISDHQPQASTGTNAVSTATDHQPQATSSSSPSTQMVACKTNSTLMITLENGVMLDNNGRTGYIAANYQFQFDKPPQAGAIYTAGWSVCSNGSLALGGDNTFYQCLSGNFYNLYNKNWAAQCTPVTIEALTLLDC